MRSMPATTDVEIAVNDGQGGDIWNRLEDLVSDMAFALARGETVQLTPSRCAFILAAITDNAEGAESDNPLIRHLWSTATRCWGEEMAGLDIGALADRALGSGPDADIYAVPEPVNG